MSYEESPSLCTLPIELINKIFGYLDAQTIVRKVRCVCKRLYRIVNEYDQYDFNLKSILKVDFSLLCNYIRHDKVVSLTLCDDDETPGQIEYFLSLFRIGQFTELRSLTLIEIDDCYLSIILKDMKTSELKSLKIHSERDYLQNNTSSDDLSSVISLKSLQKVDLNLPTFDLSRLIWPIDCTINHLEMNCRRLNDYYNIVRHFPNLRILVLQQMEEDVNNGIIDKPNDLESFTQLYSLTLKYGRIDMIILELILSLTPSIEHLQLVRCVELNAFTSYLSEWEKFIESKLSSLNKFEFFFRNDPFSFVNTTVNLESIITPFRKPFWIEKKKWFAICDYIVRNGTCILYTTSYFDPQFEYVHQSRKNTIEMNKVNKITLDLENTMSFATSTQGGLPNKTSYPNVDELKLSINSEWPLGSLRFLSNLLQLSQLVKLSLRIDNSFYYYAQLRNNIEKLFQLATNIRFLEILISTGYMGTVSDRNMTICSLIPINVKHLTLSVSTVNQMQMVIQQLKHLSSIKFEYTNTYDPSELHLYWIEKQNQSYKYRLNRSSISLWFDNQL